MKNYFILAFFFISGCSSNQPIHLKYEGQSYYIPNAIEEIGSLSSQGNFLIIKYSREKGQKYLAFSNSELTDKGDCDYSEFFDSVVGRGEINSLCDKGGVSAFKDAFTSGPNNGYWQINGFDYYYFVTENTGTFVFIVLSGDELIKIDSDFLTPKDMRSVIESVE